MTEQTTNPLATPEGVGLSIEEVRQLLAKAHETVVDKNDPILMVVTMLNAHLGEVEKLQGRHRDGLNKFMAEKTDNYVKGVQAAISQLTESLSASSVEGIRKASHLHSLMLEAFKTHLYCAAAIITVSALVNVAVFVLVARG